MREPTFVALRACFLTAGLLLGTALASDAAPALPAGSLYDETLRFTDDSGARVELSRFRGRPVALAMFYSDCTTTCSITLEKLREIEKTFQERGIDADFVLVSYDARLDTPRALARFREKQKLPSTHWHLLSGSAESVRSLANRIGLGDYRDLGDHIAHSFRILLLDEKGVAQKALDPLHARVSSLFEPPQTQAR